MTCDHDWSDAGLGHSAETQAYRANFIFHRVLPGFIDYLNLINLRDGGANGVKFTRSECEPQYEVERGVESYERQKSHKDIAVWTALSVGIAYAVIDRITQDKVPLTTINHGRADSTDGRVFPYVFPLLLDPYSEMSGIVNYIASRPASPSNSSMIFFRA